MKKNLIFIFAVLVFILPLTAMAAEEFRIPTVKDKNGKVESFCSVAVNGSVYLLSNRGNLYSINEAERTLKPIPLKNMNPEYEKPSSTVLLQHGILEGMETPDGILDDARGINRLDTDGTTLYGTNITTGALYRVAILEDTAELHAQCMLDFAAEDKAANYPLLFDIAFCGGKAYASISWGSDGADHGLYAFDLATGSRTLTDVKDPVFEIEAYHPGQLLLIKENMPGVRSISVYDTATQEQHTMFQESMKGIGKDISDMLYDVKNDRIIIQSVNRIMALLNDGTTKTVNHFQQRWYTGRAVLPSGAMAIADSEVFIRDIDTEKEPPTPLRVACNSLGDVEFSYESENPELLLSIESMNPEKAEELFIRQMNIASSDIDIYEIPIGMVLENAVSKGYYTPLEGSPAIAQRAAHLYPFLSDKMMDGMHIAALPRQLEHRTVAYSKYAMAQLGLTEEDLPKTLAGFMDFCAKWEESYGEIAYEKGISLFEVSSAQVRSNLLHQIMGQYFSLADADLQSALDKQDVLVTILEKLKQMISSLSKQAPPAEPFEPTSRYSVDATPSYLFSLHASSDPGRRNFTTSRRSVSNFVPMNLPLFDGMKPQFYITGSAFVINPYSTQIEAAKKLLSYYAEKFPVSDGAALFDDTVPTESRDYTILKNRYTYEIKSLKEKLPFVTGIEKKDMEAEIARNEAYLQSVELIKWEVSKEALDDYQKVLAQCSIHWQKKSLYVDSITRIWDQYVQGSMDTQGFTKELTQIFQMIVTENP